MTRVSPCPISNCSLVRSQLNAEGGHNGKKSRREGERRKEKDKKRCLYIQGEDGLGRDETLYLRQSS